VSGDKQDYNLREIRKLLRKAFTPDHLKRVCLDSDALRPVVDDFGTKHSLNDMVDAVIDYCRTYRLFDELLKEVKRENPAQYALSKKKLRVSVASTGEDSSTSAEDGSEGSAAWRMYRSAGDEAFSSENWSLAIEEYTLALDETPDDAKTYGQRGWAYIEMGEVDEAIRDLNRSIALSPSYAAYHRRGIAYYRKQRYDQALSDYNEALKRYPKAGATLWNRGLVRQAQGDKLAAIWDFVECATINSTYRKEVKEKLGELSTPPLPVPPYVSILSSPILSAFHSERVKDVPWTVRASRVAGHFVALGPEADLYRSQPTKQEVQWKPPEPRSESGIWVEKIPVNWLAFYTQQSEVESLAAKHALLDDEAARRTYKPLEGKLQAALLPDNPFNLGAVLAYPPLRAEPPEPDKVREIASLLMEMGLLYWGKGATDHGRELLEESWLIFYQLEDARAEEIRKYLDKGSQPGSIFADPFG